MLYTELQLTLNSAILCTTSKNVYLFIPPNVRFQSSCSHRSPLALSSFVRFYSYGVVYSTCLWHFVSRISLPYAKSSHDLPTSWSLLKENRGAGWGLINNEWGKVTMVSQGLPLRPTVSRVPNLEMAPWRSLRQECNAGMLIGRPLMLPLFPLPSCNGALHIRDKTRVFS